MAAGGAGGGGAGAADLGFAAAAAVTEPGKGGEIQLTDAMRRVLADGGKGVGIRLRPDERRYDIGNFDSYFKTFVDFALAAPEYGESLTDHVRQLMIESPKE